MSDKNRAADKAAPEDEAPAPPPGVQADAPEYIAGADAAPEVAPAVSASPLVEAEPAPRVGGDAPVLAPPPHVDEVIGAEPDPVQEVVGPPRVSAEEFASPVVRAANASALANLEKVLLRAGQRVHAALAAIDIHSGKRVHLEAGARVPEGRVLIPRNLVREDRLPEEKK